MLDARYLAFKMVLQEGSFELASRRLHLTQSAVSQRIRQLEEELGQVLIVRSKPARATTAGQKLLPYLSRIAALENEAHRELKGSNPAKPFKLAIGVNADSLATWFWPAVQDSVIAQKLILDCVIDDQDYTHTLLAAGDVHGCISTQASAMRGCTISPLGIMRYRCLASPSFKAKYFPTGMDRNSLAQAPAIIYGRKDDQHALFLHRQLGLPASGIPHHVIPSSEGFVTAALAGLGYGFIPEIQVSQALADKALIDITDNAYEDVPLFWHCWSIPSAPLQTLGKALQTAAQTVLRQ